MPNKSPPVAPCLYGAHVRANGIRQHYLRFGGSGTALIIVPGITSPAATWAFVGERLGTLFDTYVLDLRGRGLSESGPHLRHDLDTCAEDIAQFASALGLRDFHVLGHSLGARIAARLGSRPDVSLGRLVLADPPLSGPGRRPYGRALSFYIDSIREAQQGLLDAEAVRKTYPTWTEANLRARAEWLHTCDEHAIAQCVSGFQTEEIQSDFARLRSPTLLLVAGRGGIISAEDVSELHTLMPALEVQRIEHTGHMIPFDDLEAFLAAVTPFLQDARRG
ncbi:MAG: alpha/beta hydrolase [Burkholderiaceae bacterium]|nr:alpha/beta hydrolase [Burkholderiaceae bacterium]